MSQSSNLKQILKAVKKGDIAKLSELLQSFDMNEVEIKTQRRLLQIIMQESDENVFDFIIKVKGISINEIDLLTAIRLNNSYYVTKILSMNVTPNANILQYSMQNQTNNEILERIMQSKPNFIQKINNYGSYLNVAVISGQLQNVIFLLRNKIDFRIQDENDNTCLILAAIHGHGNILVTILEYLSQSNLQPLEKQFFLNAQNDSGNTALHQAYFNKQQTIADTILRFGKPMGVDQFIRNKNNIKPSDIREKNQNQHKISLQLQKKKSQENIIRRKQKEIEKQRLRQEEEKQRKRIQMENIKIEEEKKIQKIVRTEIGNKKRMWITIIIIVVTLSLIYIAFLKAAAKKKIDRPNV